MACGICAAASPGSPMRSSRAAARKVAIGFMAGSFSFGLAGLMGPADGGVIGGGASLAQPFDDDVEDGNESEAEQRRRQHAAEHGGADRLAAGRAGAGGDQQRNDAEDEGEGGHEDRPQPEACRFHGGVENSGSFAAATLGEFDDQDGVLGG